MMRSIMNIIDTPQGLWRVYRATGLISITDICVSPLPCMVIHSLSLGFPSTGCKCASSWHQHTLLSLATSFCNHPHTGQVDKQAYWKTLWRELSRWVQSRIGTFSWNISRDTQRPQAVPYRLCGSFLSRKFLFPITPPGSISDKWSCQMSGLHFLK